MTARRIFLLGFALSSAIVGAIIWFIRETFKEIDAVSIHPQESAW